MNFNIKIDNLEELTDDEEEKKTSNGIIIIFKNNLKYSYILNDPQLYHYFEHVFVVFLAKKFKQLKIVNALTSPYMITCYFTFTSHVNEKKLFQTIKDILTNKLQITENIFETEGSRIYSEILSKSYQFYESIYPAGVGVDHDELVKKKFSYNNMFDSIYGLINNFSTLNYFHFDWFQPNEIICPISASIPLNLFSVHLQNNSLYLEHIIVPFEYNYSFLALTVLTELLSDLNFHIEIKTNYNYSYFSLIFGSKPILKFKNMKAFIEYVIDEVTTNFFSYMQDINPFHYKMFTENELLYIDFINKNDIKSIRKILTKEVNDIKKQIKKYLNFY